MLFIEMLGVLVLLALNLERMVDLIGMWFHLMVNVMIMFILAVKYGKDVSKNESEKNTNLNSIKILLP